MIYFSLNYSSDNRFIITETATAPDLKTLTRTIHVFREVIANTSLCVSVSPNFPTNPFLTETHLSVLTSMHSHLQTVVSKMEALQQQTLPVLQQELQIIKQTMNSLSWNSFNTLIQAIPSSLALPTSLELPILTVDDILLHTEPSSSQSIVFPTAPIRSAQLPLPPVTPPLTSHKLSHKRKTQSKTSSNPKKEKITTKSSETIEEKALLLQQKALTEKVLEAMGTHRTHILSCKERLLKLQTTTTLLASDTDNIIPSEKEEKEESIILEQKKLKKVLQAMGTHRAHILSCKERLVQLNPIITQIIEHKKEKTTSYPMLPSSSIELIDLDNDDVIASDEEDLSNPFSSSSHTSIESPSMLIPQPRVLKKKTQLPPVPIIDSPANKNFPFVLPIFIIRKMFSRHDTLKLQLSYKARYHYVLTHFNNKIRNTTANNIILANQINTTNLKIIINFVDPINEESFTFASHQRDTAWATIRQGLSHLLHFYTNDPLQTFHSVKGTQILQQLKNYISEIKTEAEPICMIQPDIMDTLVATQIEKLKLSSSTVIPIENPQTQYSSYLFSVLKKETTAGLIFNFKYTQHSYKEIGLLNKKLRSSLKRTLDYAFLLLENLNTRVSYEPPEGCLQKNLSPIKILRVLLSGLLENQLYHTQSKNHPISVFPPNTQDSLKKIIKKIKTICLNYPVLHSFLENLPKKSLIIKKLILTDQVKSSSKNDTSRITPLPTDFEDLPHTQTIQTLEKKLNFSIPDSMNSNVGHTNAFLFIFSISRRVHEHYYLHYALRTTESNKRDLLQKTRQILEKTTNLVHDLLANRPHLSFFTFDEPFGNKRVIKNSEDLWKIILTGLLETQQYYYGNNHPLLNNPLYPILAIKLNEAINAILKKHSDLKADLLPFPSIIPTLTQRKADSILVEQEQHPTSSSDNSSISDSESEDTC